VVTLPQGSDALRGPLQHITHRAFRRFMARNQYTILPASVALGLLLALVYRLLSLPWFLSRLLLLFTIITFVPAGLVVLAHVRERFGPLGWYLAWEDSDAAWTTRRSRPVERIEIIVMSVLWSLIFLFVIAVLFVLSRPR